MPDKKKLTKKKGKQRRVISKKKTKSKKRSQKIKPENINKILSDIRILLSFPSIEFLPSTNIFSKNNTGHYIQMIDYQELAYIINQNTRYKKSPTIQKVFNYQSYKLEIEEEIVFNYNNIKCDNLIIKEQKNYNVKLLFLYLLECNITERLKDIIQLGGDDEYDIEKMINYDMGKKKDEFEDFERKEKESEREKELEKVRELEREKFKERRRLEDEQRNIRDGEEKERELRRTKKFEEDIKEQTEKVITTNNISNGDINEEITEERKILHEIEGDQNEYIERKEHTINTEERRINEEIRRKELFEIKMKEEEKEMKENALQDRIEMEKKIEIKLKGFEEFLENKKVSNLSKNSFALYNVNWFNVCCGLEKLDDFFEEDIQTQITDMGLILNEDEIRENLISLFEDKRELFMFKNMMKNRLITCSELEPPSFFEKLFTNSFGTFKNCDERSPQSLLYLYDDYRNFLEKDMGLTKLERVLILIYCETRQHSLSKYISLEIIRKDNEKKKKEKIMSILDKVMDSDKSIIKENDKILEQQMKLKYKGYKAHQLEVAKEKNRIKTLVSGNNIIIQKDKLRNLEDEKEITEENEIKVIGQEKSSMLDKIVGLFETNEQSPIFDIALTPKEREAYQKAMKKMKGGSQINYESTKESMNNICNQIKGEKNIYKSQLDMINHCS